MKKLLSYVFCLQFLAISFVPSSKLIELYKINNLLSHFSHHQIVHKEDINFVEFLVLHYLDKKHEHTDSNEHGGLPFHNASNQSTTATISFLFTSPPFFSWDFRIVNIEMLDSHKTTYQDNYFPSFHLSIWQPPRFA